MIRNLNGFECNFTILKFKFCCISTFILESFLLIKIEKSRSPMEKPFDRSHVKNMIENVFKKKISENTNEPPKFLKPRPTGLVVNENLKIKNSSGTRYALHFSYMI